MAKDILLEEFIIKEKKHMKHSYFEHCLLCSIQNNIACKQKNIF